MKGKRRKSPAEWLSARWYGTRPAWFLWPLAVLFRLLAWLRRSLYRLGLFRTRQVAARVVVVGNITVGGSGKTPLVAWLARELSAAGVKTGIVTRGYGGNRNDVRLIRTDASADEAGDEPLWLARETAVPVVAGRDRAAAARYLVESHRPDVVVSDDGLQHYRLVRDVEIAAIDARRGFGNGALLPAGPLREMPSRLERVNAVVLKGRGQVALPPGVTVFNMLLSVSRALPVGGGESVPLAHFRGKPVHAVAAIADPEGFFVVLEAAGLEVERHPLPDHAPIDSTLEMLGTGRPILLTDKDAARLAERPVNAWRVPLAIGFSGEDAAGLLALAGGPHFFMEES
ncbi:MAG: tetraacyldisaccharide 4'-kinase [Gammaproteobacteria bacterium]|nr:tetraacyldisaccharide 4'-kinase [Gammaproteobacteria bacterium]